MADVRQASGRALIRPRSTALLPGLDQTITRNVNDLLRILAATELRISPGAGQRLQTAVEGLNRVISRLGNMGYGQLFAELETRTEDMLEAMRALRGGAPEWFA